MLLMLWSRRRVQHLFIAIAPTII